MGWTRAQVAQAFTANGLTRDFRHLLPIPRALAIRRTWHENPLNVVKPKERIKYWNIVPGDQVRIRGDPHGTLYEVNMINRLTNRVLLRTESDKGENPEDQKKGKNVAYSRCQLFVGQHEFPPELGSTERKSLPVFARRITTSGHYYSRLLHGHTWKRWAVSTIPQLPHLNIGENERVKIPWPKRDPRLHPRAGPQDTPDHTAKEVTYSEPRLPIFSDPTNRQPVLASEDDYIRLISKPGDSSDFNDQPVELFLGKELANPHSRAKKQARWQARKEYTRALLDQFIAAEIKILQGRTRREARAEATWKWRHHLEEERKAETKRRWRDRGGEARLVRKQARKERKDQKQRERLRNLVLEEGPNQIIPGAPSPAA
ncbi:uncharacterized protein LAESUDRAFT_718995 [Laetiporus sulphureus 93-53]|uniref:KOW domain-containing protein n=1 Tax=Laetiporus sulphureus 93-53 TaxID=1314785 RepID=A0A165I7Z7_9APHY|nr:uncharacterized protein LAESUDRAFT_718995 [Laetiporus sulphureus 93-53]KZT12707.1 hypothetical protein LAESUDRAFT_718995 [Laetiporus sulphureus 93-53]